MAGKPVDNDRMRGRRQALRPRRPRLGAGLAAASLAVCAALAGLWARSYWALERLSCSSKHSVYQKDCTCFKGIEYQCNIDSGNGMVSFFWGRDTRDGLTRQDMLVLAPYYGIGTRIRRVRQPDARFMSGPGGAVGAWHTLRWGGRTEVGDPGIRLRAPTLQDTSSWWYVALPYWMLMLPWIAQPIWWALCPPGRAIPRLTPRGLMAVIAILALALGGLSAFWRASATDRALDAISTYDVTMWEAEWWEAEWKITKDPSAAVRVWINPHKLTDADLARLQPALAALPGLRDLKILYNEITDSGLVSIRGLTRLERLGLSGRRITGSGLVHLSRLPRLRKLSLGGTGITDANLAHLSEFPNIEELSVWDTAITDAGLVHFLGLPNLRKLDLNQTRVTPAGVARLRRALPHVEITD